MSTSLLADWLSRIQRYHPCKIDLDLKRVGAVAKSHGLDNLHVPVITVGGTNGKGSCVACIESIFSEAGYRTGAYTSPHLHDFNERLRINQHVLASSVWCQAFDQIETWRDQLPLTFFEFTTLAALLILKQYELDVVILEVGLGGRLDAVNVVDPTLSIITNVALDHEAYLGFTRESIGREKAGIFRKDRCAIYGESHIPSSVVRHASEVGANLYCAGQSFVYQQHLKDWSLHIMAGPYFESDSCSKSKSQILEPLPFPSLPLPSSALAVVASQWLFPQAPVALTAIQSGLAKACLPGRFQQVNNGVPRDTIFDVAHNPAAGHWLAHQLQKHAVAGKTLAVVGMLSDKDSVGTLEPLLEWVDEWFAAPLNTPSSWSSSLLLGVFQRFAVEVNVCKTLGEAYHKAVDSASENDRVLVFGSFYAVAEVQAYIGTVANHKLAVPL